MERARWAELGTCTSGARPPPVPTAKEQLYSTSSYQRSDLARTNLSSLELSGADFTSQDLTHARFWRSDITDADFSNAIVNGVDFQEAKAFSANQIHQTASYKLGSLTDINFMSLDLSRLRFEGMDIRGANLTNATEQGFTAEQLYATRSYQRGNLAGISLIRNDLSGWNLSNLNLTHASIWSADLTNTHFQNSIIREASIADDTFRLFVTPGSDPTVIFQRLMEEW